MTLDIKKITAVFRDPKRRVWAVMGIGIFCMLLIFMTRDTGSGEAPEAEPVPEQAVQPTMDEHAERLEERLADLISQIDGVGRVMVMVTMQDSGEYVFAREERRNTDAERHPETAQGTSGRTLERESIEDRYVMVESEDGRRQALVRTRLKPRVQGVVVLAEGADDIRVQARIVNVVTTALNISSARVSVEKIKSYTQQHDDTVTQVYLIY